MDYQQAHSIVSNVAHMHLPRNTRSYDFEFISSFEPLKSSLGFFLDLKPFEGKLVAIEGGIAIIKCGRRDLVAVALCEIEGDVSEIGSKVIVEPYARCRFDGSKFYEPRIREIVDANGVSSIFESFILGEGDMLFLPIPDVEIGCYQLQELIRQLEVITAPGSPYGYRKIAHMLADANASDFKLVNPSPAKILDTPPEVSFHVDTASFKGRIAVRYECGSDTYTILTLEDGGDTPNVVKDVYFDDLGRVFKNILVDEHWKKVRVTPVGRVFS